MIEYAERLANSELFSFADWPNLLIPDVCAGVYAIYDENNELIYVGMAGARLSNDTIKRKTASGKRSGLLDRLNSHASGIRSGDRFNIYIARPICNAAIKTLGNTVDC